MQKPYVITVPQPARIVAAGISGKTGWIQVEVNGHLFGGSVSKSLVKQLAKAAR